VKRGSDQGFFFQIFEIEIWNYFSLKIEKLVEFTLVRKSKNSPIFFGLKKRQNLSQENTGPGVHRRRLNKSDFFRWQNFVSLLCEIILEKKLGRIYFPSAI
jgi:hypothetical protein